MPVPWAFCRSRLEYTLRAIVSRQDFWRDNRHGNIGLKTMNRYHRIRSQQLLREAEGYLDLVMSLADRWPTRRETAERLANRALETLDRLSPQDADRAQVLYLRGQSLRLLERYADAVAPLREAADRDPTNIHIYLALGWCYKRVGRLDLAIETLEQSLAFEDGEAILHYNLACYWSMAENVRLAVEYLSQAFDIDPNFRDLVPSEPDFEPIRNHPQFMALTIVVV